MHFFEVFEAQSTTEPGQIDACTTFRAVKQRNRVPTEQVKKNPLRKTRSIVEDCTVNQQI